jgi:branched-subunit amino acid aminotransferase/4-amino-4-deoxychorismate lyase
MGVTRSLVLEVAASLLPLDPVPPRIDELARLDEAFVTSVSRGILPVIEIDGHRLGSGRPGPLTQRLREAFAALEAREVERL